MTFQERAWHGVPEIPAPLSTRSSGKSALAPLAGLALILVLQATMVFGRAINWDEYWHYSLVHLFDRGTLYTPLQTFFIRLAQGLPLLPGSAVDHIIVARFFMFACEIAAAGGVALLAARFTDRTIGLLAALCYLSGAFVLQHGFSFRADPALTALSMGALCVLGCTTFRGFWVFFFGALLALAGIFSIKVILYAPAFAGLAWLRWREENSRPALLLRLLAGAAVAAGCFALLYLYHSRVGVEVDTSAETVLSRSAQKMFVLGLPPYLMMAAKFALLSLPFTAMILFFPLALRRSRLDVASRIALAGLFLPLATLAFYHNTAPYFYVFMLAPVAVACALPIAIIVCRYGAAVPALVFASAGVAVWMQEDFSVITRQRAIMRAADQIFPERIAYFDFCAMLARHDKSNAFMTPFMGAVYRGGGMASMTQVMREKAVPLVVEDDPMFTRLLRTLEPAPEFLPQDAAALRDTYLHYWGPFWVAGRDIPTNARDLIAQFRVPGPYRLSGGSIEVDGKLLRQGSIIRLERGAHRLTWVGGKAARLLWGDHLRMPTDTAPTGPHWVYF